MLRDFPQQTNQQHNLYEQQQQFIHHQQDSGISFYDSIARGQEYSNHSLKDDGTYDVQNSYTHKFNSQFHPRRQCSSRIVNSFASSQSSRHEFVDHDYATNSSNLDILHYAGELETTYELDQSEPIDKRTRSFSSSCVHLPKKPCLDSPTSPFKLYRRKMF